MIMPEGLDPADFVAEHGADGGARGRHGRAAARRVHAPPHDRPPRPVDASRASRAAVAEALPILERLTDPVRRSEYAHLVADLAGVTESSVVQPLDAARGGQPAEVASSRPKRMTRRATRSSARC